MCRGVAGTQQLPPVRRRKALSLKGLDGGAILRAGSNWLPFGIFAQLMAFYTLPWRLGRLACVPSRAQRSAWPEPLNGPAPAADVP
jgi:hypothetical protein